MTLSRGRVHLVLALALHLFDRVSLVVGHLDGSVGSLILGSSED